MGKGLELEGTDSAIRPQDDLFRHVNGSWLAATEIQPDRATAGAFVDLVDESERITREIVERCGEAPATDEQRKIIQQLRNKSSYILIGGYAFALQCIAQ